MITTRTYKGRKTPELLAVQRQIAKVKESIEAGSVNVKRARKLIAMYEEYDAGKAARRDNTLIRSPAARRRAKKSVAQIAHVSIDGSSSDESDREGGNKGNAQNGSSISSKNQKNQKNQKPSLLQRAALSIQKKQEEAQEFATTSKTLVSVETLASRRPSRKAQHATRFPEDREEEEDDEEVENILNPQRRRGGGSSGSSLAGGKGSSSSSSSSLLLLGVPPPSKRRKEEDEPHESSPPSNAASRRGMTIEKPNVLANTPRNTRRKMTISPPPPSSSAISSLSPPEYRGRRNQSTSPTAASTSPSASTTVAVSRTGRPKGVVVNRNPNADSEDEDDLMVLGEEDFRYNVRGPTGRFTSKKTSSSRASSTSPTAASSTVSASLRSASSKAASSASSSSSSASKVASMAAGFAKYSSSPSAPNLQRSMYTEADDDDGEELDHEEVPAYSQQPQQYPSSKASNARLASTTSPNSHLMQARAGGGGMMASMSSSQGVGVGVGGSFRSKSLTSSSPPPSGSMSIRGASSVSGFSPYAGGSGASSSTTTSTANGSFRSPQPRQMHSSQHLMASRGGNAIISGNMPSSDDFHPSPSQSPSSLLTRNQFQTDEYDQALCHAEETLIRHIQSMQTVVDGIHSIRQFMSRLGHALPQSSSVQAALGVYKDGVMNSLHEVNQLFEEE
jgi:hypothetical protein